MRNELSVISHLFAAGWAEAARAKTNRRSAGQAKQIFNTATL
jgi:hypothetical protein